MISLLELFLVVIIFLMFGVLGVFLFLARGLPWKAMMARLKGKFLLLICKRTRELASGPVDVKFGVARTKKSGSFNILPEKVYSAGGIPVGICPEDVGFNISPEDAQVSEWMEKQGIHDIREITDRDAYDRVKNLKDDPKIIDSKTKKPIPIKIEQRTTDFNTLYRYVQKASHPAGQDANIDYGIAEGTLGLGMGKMAYLIPLGIFIFLIFLGLIVFRTMNPTQPIINVTIENVIRENIPAVIPA